MERKARCPVKDFSEEAYVKVIGVSGDYHYGYIQKVTERGFHLLISLFDEGESALGYETASGAMAADWPTMLSDTERAIVIGLSCGLSTKEMAAELSLSPSTVRTHIRELRLKLQLDNRQELVVFSQGMDKVLQEKEK